MQSITKIVGGLNKGQRLLLFCMAFPFFVQLVIFNYIPLWGWLMAFVDYSPGVSILHSHFAGFKYFVKLFSGGSEFLIVMRNTLVLSILSFITLPMAIALAIMITESKNVIFKKLVQTASSLPNFISWVIVYSIFYNFLSLDDGFINEILQKLHLIDKPIAFLTSERLVWPLQTFINVWKNLGWTAIIFISAISGIDPELYQAASVDGAGRIKKILNITIPSIMPTFVVIMLLSVGSLLNTGFEQYFMFHNGLVHNYIEVIDTYTYRQGIAQGNYSFATAVGIFKSVVSVVLLVSVNSLAKATTDKSIL